MKISCKDEQELEENKVLNQEKQNKNQKKSPYYRVCDEPEFSWHPTVMLTVYVTVFPDIY